MVYETTVTKKISGMPGVVVAERQCTYCFHTNILAWSNGLYKEYCHGHVVALFIGLI